MFIDSEPGVVAADGVEAVETFEFFAEEEADAFEL